MSDSITIRRIGKSLGIVLPKSELDTLGVDEGDQLFLVRTPDGVQLVPYDPDLAAAVVDAREYMRRHRDSMRELAK